MRILLVGEYSNFHNSLKYGLEFLGHEVTILGDGDGFKNYPVDIDLRYSNIEKSPFFDKLKAVILRLTGKNIADRLRWARFRESEDRLKNFDIVQFINSNALGCYPNIERKMIQFLLKHNHRFFLTACGDDCEYVDYLVNHHSDYSILDPVRVGSQTKGQFVYTYKYLQPNYRANYETIVAACSAVIPVHTDYAMALQEQPKAVGLIPAPVQCGKYQLDLNADLSTIHIFLGINTSNYWKKGINYFEDAVEIIASKYTNRVKINTVKDLPYDEYMQQFKKAHIVLDQVLGYDQGYNALEAMLQGKVVFTGGGGEFLKARNLESVPVIDARPNVDYLVDQLSRLIEHPTHILKLGMAARNHVLHHHESVMIAQKYLDIYSQK